MNRKLATVALSAIGLVVGATSAQASSFQGMITNVTPVSNRVYIVVSGNASNTPACTTSTTQGVYSFDLTTALGKALLATALSAKLAGKLVYTYGDGTCLPSNPYDGSSSENLFGMDLKG